MNFNTLRSSFVSLTLYIGLPSRYLMQMPLEKSHSVSKSRSSKFLIQHWSLPSLIHYHSIVDEFRSTLEHTDVNKFVQFDFNCDFIKLHFGEKRDRPISYQEFTQVLWVRFIPSIMNNSSGFRIVKKFLVHFYECCWFRSTTRSMRFKLSGNLTRTKVESSHCKI